MKIYFSDFFEIEDATLEEYGAFNISLINDLPLFVDPFLLFNSDNNEYRALHERVIKYMRFLKDMSLGGTADPSLIDAWYTFPEVRQNWLGFSRSGNQGHGLGLDFAQALNRNLTGIFRDFGAETVSRSSHIEKLCLVRDGVGRDNISDFTTNLIKGYLAEYTQRFAQKEVRSELRRRVPLRRADFNYETRSWVTTTFDLPWHDGDYVLLTPKDILTKDEAWICRPDLIDRFEGIAASLPDKVLRAQVNEYMIRVLPQEPQATKRAYRAAIARVIEKFPQTLDYYVREKEETGDRATSVAEANVLEAQILFVERVRQLARELLARTGFYDVAGTTWDEAMARLQYLIDVIENKGGHKIFHSKGKPMTREADLHIMYRLTWFATPSDLSTEVNDGRGPADFKASRGAPDKTIIEFKLGSNSQLKTNLQKQTQIYELASDATHTSIKAIVILTERQEERVQRILKDLKMEADKNVVLIDARADNKSSGSRA